MTTWSVNVSMLSDWHIGTGTGRPGDIDRLVRRDRDGLPYVPAKTLTGTWRDACERAAFALDDGMPSGPWASWVEVLFGTQAGHPDQPGGGLRERGPRPASLSVRPAHFAGALRRVVAETPAVRDAVTIVRPGVRIDPISGRAMEDHLRFVEHARGGCELRTTATLDDGGWDEDQRQSALALLVVGASLLDRLGGKRRRGAGRCSVRLGIESDRLGEHLTWLRNHPAPSNQPLPHPGHDPVYKRGDLAAGPANQERSSDKWEQVELIVTLDTPLCASAAIVGNVVVTRDHVPATLLLPALLRALGSSVAERAARAGDLVVSNATLGISGRQGWAIPRCLVHPKGTLDLDQGGTMTNILVASAEGTLQMKAHRSGHVAPISRQRLPLAFDTPERLVATHNVIDDQVQRPTSDVGGVFTMEAIAEGTVLRSRLRIRQSVADSLGDDWLTRLAGPAALGRSKKDDYGQVTITTGGAAPAAPRRPADGRLRVWVLSDILLRDQRLRPAFGPEAMAWTLSERLGVGLRPDTDASSRWWVGVPDRVESWHQRWQLPRPSLVGIAAGSVASFSIDGDLDEALLDEVEDAGIGERRAEGFGRIRFNDVLLSETTVEGPRPSEPDAVNRRLLAAADRDHDMARTIERAAWRAEIERSSTLAAVDPLARRRVLGFHGSKPGPSQLGALRTVVSRLRSFADRPVVLGWIRDIERVGNRRAEWPDGVRRFLTSLVERDDDVWNVLGLSGEGGRRLCLTDDGYDALRGDLWAEAVRAVVVRAAQAQADSLRGGI